MSALTATVEPCWDASTNSTRSRQTADQRWTEGSRPATRDDVAQIVALAAECHQEVQAQRGGGRLSGDLALDTLGAVELGKLLDDQSTGVFVGLLDGVVVGCAIVEPHPLGSEAQGGAAWVRVLFVEGRARRMGVGESLLAACVPWCVANGFTELDTPALPGDRNTKAFFETQGFRARLLVMSRSINP